MRKMATAFICLAIFAGCGRINVADAKIITDKGFESDITLIWKDKTYSGNISSVPPDILTLNVWGENLTVPVKYEISQGGYSLSQGDLGLKIPYSEAPPESVAVIVYEAFLAAAQAEVSTDKGIAVYTLPTAIIKQDIENDTLISIEMKDGQITFSNFILT